MNVVIRTAKVSGELAGQRRQQGARGEREEAAVRHGVLRVTPRVIGDPREASAWPALHRQLQAVISTRRIGHELCHVAEAWVEWCAVRIRREAAVAYGLIAVNVHPVGQIAAPRPD